MGFMAQERENCAVGGAIVEQKARIWPTNSVPEALMLRAFAQPYGPDDQAREQD